MAPQPGPKRIKTVGTVFDVVEAVLERERCGVTELAEELGKSKSTVHAHLSTLEERGYLVKEDEEYRLGLPFLTLGGSVQSATTYKKLYAVAKPEVDELAQTTDERAQIMVEENGHGYYLYQSSGSRAVVADSFIGYRVPLHTTAVGKSYLAAIGEERTADIVDRHGLQQDTEQSITDRGEFRDQLAEIEERGYAFDRGERVPGIHCVGAPIVTDDEEVLGSISVSVPAKRSDGDFFEHELPRSVMNAARVIALNATYA